MSGSDLPGGYTTLSFAKCNSTAAAVIVITAKKQSEPRFKMEVVIAAAELNLSLHERHSTEQAASEKDKSMLERKQLHIRSSSEQSRQSARRSEQRSIH
jgi:hypothetical protein